MEGWSAMWPVSDVLALGFEELFAASMGNHGFLSQRCRSGVNRLLLNAIGVMLAPPVRGMAEWAGRSQERASSATMPACRRSWQSAD